MKRFILLLSLTMFCGSMSAQVRYSDDPHTTINMDIEAKSKSAVLIVETFSKTNQIVPDAYVVLTFMDDSSIKLTGRVRNINKMIDSDQGHGFADRFHSYARIKISPEQAEMFKKGMKSILIRMAPNAYYKEWEKDEMGLPLYHRYLVSKENVMFKTN